MMDRLSISARAEIARAMMATMRNIAARVRVGDDWRIEMPYFRQRLAPIMEAIPLRVAAAMLRHHLPTLRRVKHAQRNMLTKDQPLPYPIDAVNIAQEYMLLYPPRRHFAGIDEALSAAIRKIVSIGLESGRGERAGDPDYAPDWPSISDQILSIAPTLARHRAGTIARTEVHTAMGYSQRAIIDATGIELRRKVIREWVSTDGVSGERTRQSHIEADGQQVGAGESYLVGGVYLRYPGDPDGPAQEVINCRCQEIYIFPDE
jgi:hypothetical protein